MEKQHLKSMLSINSITDKDWADALWATGQYITYKLKGNPQTGPYSEGVIGVMAAEYFSRLAFEVLFSKRWKLKENFTLKQQMKKAADGLMTNHKKHYENNPAPIFESFEDYSQMLLDTLVDEDDNDNDNLEEAYERAETAANNDPDLLEFLCQMRRCANYEDIATEMGITINDVYNLVRRLKRRLQ